MCLVLWNIVKFYVLTILAEISFSQSILVSLGFFGPLKQYICVRYQLSLHFWICTRSVSEYVKVSVLQNNVHCGRNDFHSQLNSTVHTHSAAPQIPSRSTLRSLQSLVTVELLTSLLASFLLLLLSSYFMCWNNKYKINKRLILQLLVVGLCEMCFFSLLPFSLASCQILIDSDNHAA